MNNPISPTHYKLFSSFDDFLAKELEARHVIEASLTKEEFLGYLKGNILKYMLRHKNKNGIEDLNKARTYMRFLDENISAQPKGSHNNEDK